MNVDNQVVLIKKILLKDDSVLVSEIKEIIKLKNIEEKLKTFEIIKKYIDGENKRKNRLKILNEISNTILNDAIIHKNSEITIKVVKALNEYLKSEELINFLKESNAMGNISLSSIIAYEILKRSGAQQTIVENQDLLNIIKTEKDISNYQKRLMHLVDLGLHNNAIAAYEQLYYAYFQDYALSDNQAKIWEDLWVKVSNIKEDEKHWDIIKLDLGLLTDIIIKYKTGLSVPFFRKKKEITKALILGSQYKFLRYTVLKYFFESEKFELCDLIIKTFQLNTNNIMVKNNDREFEYILRFLKLNTPKQIPADGKLIFDNEESQTILLDAIKEDSSNDGLETIQEKMKEALQESTSAPNIVDMPGASWKEQIQHYALAKNLQPVKEIILKHIDELAGEEKINYQLYLLETLLGLGEFKEILTLLEGYWKDIQDLENFKILKYIEGESLWGLNRKKEAVDCFRKVIDIDPHYKLAKWRIVEFSL